jgi:glycosyltransferase involved in cell wall biosynthesis
MNTTNNRSPLPHIIILGTRGIPDVPGGVEKHVEHLAPLIAEHGYQVIVMARKPYLKEKKAYHFKGVTVIPTMCPKHKYFEAIYHTFFGCLKARIIGGDIIHIHSCGPSLFSPFAKLLGFKVVITNHGPEYERKKWGSFAKVFLKFSEWVSIYSADRVITISEDIKRKLEARYKRRDIVVIPNGVALPRTQIDADQTQMNANGGMQRGVDQETQSNTNEYSRQLAFDSRESALSQFNLTPQKYILAVGRFVPEKGFHDLIEAYSRLSADEAGMDNKEGRKDEIVNSSLVSLPLSLGIKLVIVGDADHEDEYSRSLKEKAKKNSNIVLTGFQTGEPLEALFRNAALFVLPSYYEGLPITLLEAMSYGLSCIVTDIPANRNVRIEDARTFKPGDIEELTRKMNHYLAHPISDNEKKEQIAYIKENFDWPQIAEKTIGVYMSLSVRFTKSTFESQKQC